MRQIRLAIVTAKVSEKVREKLDLMIGAGKVKYFEPFSFKEMQAMAASGATREQIMQASRKHKAAIRDFVQ